MKLFLVTLMVFGLLFVSACPGLRNSAASPDASSVLPINQQTNARQDNSNSATSSKTPIPKFEFTPKESMVWIGYVRAETLEDIEKTFALDNGTIDDSPKYSKIGMTTNVDIFNCAGYLMSGKAHKRGDFGWKFELMSETVAADAIEKMKRCDSSLEKESDEKKVMIGNYIFALAPTDKARKNTKTPNLDATGIFAQLPRSIQKKINDTSLSKEEAIRRKIKGEISAENSDQMADIDGDGKVDLIYLQQLCRDPEHPDLDGCSFLLMKINGKWKVVGVMNMA